MFMHPDEIKSDFDIRITGGRVLRVEKKVVKKTEPKVAKKAEKKEVTVKKTPEEYKQEKKEREERANARYAEKIRDNEFRRTEQEKKLKLTLDEESTSFYCLSDWNDTQAPNPTPAQVPSTPTPIPEQVQTPAPTLAQVSTQKPTPTPPLYKSSAMCRTVEAGNQCGYGDRCKFAHFLNEFGPHCCNFGKMCCFVIFDTNTGIFTNNTTKFRTCNFIHDGETRENYFDRVKIYSHIPKEKKPIVVQKFSAAKIIEYKIPKQL